jgi:hypothetical protein
VGWFYTPPVTFYLENAATDFGFRPPTSVRLSIYTELPSAGGALVASSTAGHPGFIHPTYFVFGNFPARPVLDEGQDYFLAFTGVTNVGVNLTDDPAAITLEPLYIRREFAGGVTTWEPFTNFPYPSKPILSFGGLSITLPPVPVGEPSTLWLFLATLLAFVGVSSRSKRFRIRASTAA